MHGTSLESDKYLSRTQLIVSSNLLLDIIFSTLHNGAIEKARLGFQKMCEKLLRCPRRDLRGLPAEWLERLLERLFAHDVPVVRRSSQLSFSVLAILDAEQPNTQRALLERTMRGLHAARFTFPSDKEMAIAMMEDFEFTIKMAMEQAELALNAQDLSFDPQVIGPSLQRRTSWLERRASRADLQVQPPVEMAVVNVEMPESV